MNSDKPNYIDTQSETPSGLSNESEIKSLLKEVGVNQQDVILVGSACLAVSGIRSNKDIDFLALPEDRIKLVQHARASEAYYEEKQEGAVYDGVELSICDRYEFLDLTDRELIRNPDYHIMLDGWKIIRPEIEFSKKDCFRREKDVRDLNAMIKKGLVTDDDWDWNLVNIVREQEDEYSPSLLEKGIKSVRKDGIPHTIRKTVERLFRG